MSNSSDFYSGFEALPKSQWKEIATSDLNGADFHEKLVWKTYENFDVQPYYSNEDNGENTDTNFKSVSWISYWEIDVRDEMVANKEAHKAVSFDARGLLFYVDQKIDIKKLLDGIQPQAIQVSFSGSQAVQATEDYFKYLAQAGISFKEISGFCDYDVIGEWSTLDKELTFDALAQLIKLSSSAPGFRALHLHSGDFINAGSNFTQELAFVLNKMVDYVDQLTHFGLTAAEVINNLSFELAITGDFFFEIAKIRALRILSTSVLTAYNSNGFGIPVMGSNSLWSKSQHDYHVNMIRNSSEAMAAIIGGCDTVMIKAHNSFYEVPSGFGKRIANNISNLLREESFFDKVNDPVSGSYYLEWLTNQLTKAALILFKKTEKDGGLIKSIRSGDIQDQIGRICKQKEQDLLENKFILVGSNKYIIEGESLEVKRDERKYTGTDGRILLFPKSLAEIIDKKENTVSK